MLLPDGAQSRRGSRRGTPLALIQCGKYYDQRLCGPYGSSEEAPHLTGQGRPPGGKSLVRLAAVTRLVKKASQTNKTKQNKTPRKVDL